MNYIESLESRTLFSSHALPAAPSGRLPEVARSAAAATRLAPTISTIKFSGYTWNVRSGGGNPGNNLWSNSVNSVSVDAKGQLHLKVREILGKWYSTEVFLSKSLGYGTYQFDVASRVDLTDRNVTAAGFLYANDSNEYDVEFSKWGNSHSPTNADFATQPYTAPNAIDYWHESLQPAVSTYRIIWTPGKVEIKATQGTKVLQDWVYTGPNTFAPGAEVFHFNFWINTGGRPASGTEQDYTVQDFKFTKAK